MAETRYAPSLRRLTGIVVVLVAPVAVFFWEDPFHLLLAVVSLVWMVRHTGRVHTLLLGPDFLTTAQGLRFRVDELRPATLRGSIGDVYACGSARIIASSVFLSRAQRSEIAQRLAQLKTS